MRINPRVAGLVCSLTGQRVEDDGFARPIGLCGCCPAPGRPVEVRYADGGQLGHGSVRGMWRYSDWLPVIDVPQAYGADVGGTPVRCLGSIEGLEVWVKDEGSNPSGSFKDRGLAMALALGVACGAGRFCLPTQGNAGVAASMFSARLGLSGCLVTMPEGHRGSPYHRAAALYGAEVSFHGPNIASAGAEMRRRLGSLLASGEVVDVSTFFEPGRLEGKKTMGFEIVEAFDPLPDVIVYPTGGGTGLVGIAKAFEELGVSGRPRMVAVQSEQCAPVVEAFDRGDPQVTPITSRGTVADGLDVPGAIMGHRILSVLRDSGGGAVAVSEAQILSGWRALGAMGVAGGLEAAATFAALTVLRDRGMVSAGERVLLLVTSGPSVALEQVEVV